MLLQSSFTSPSSPIQVLDPPSHAWDQAPARLRRARLPRQPDRAAAPLVKPAGPDLSRVRGAALSAPSTGPGRGVARAMGSPPRACASAMRRIDRPRRPPSIAPGHGVIGWVWVPGRWAVALGGLGGRILAGGDGAVWRASMVALSRPFCHWCSGRIGLNYLQRAYRLHLISSGLAKCIYLID